MNSGVIKTLMSLGDGEVRVETLAAPLNARDLKRLGEPEEVADLALAPCSGEARRIPGQSILVDGGSSIPGWH